MAAYLGTRARRGAGEALVLSGCGGGRAGEPDGGLLIADEYELGPQLWYFKDKQHYTFVTNA